MKKIDADARLAGPAPDFENEMSRGTTLTDFVRVRPGQEVDGVEPRQRIAKHRGDALGQIVGVPSHDMNRWQPQRPCLVDIRGKWPHGSRICRQS